MHTENGFTYMEIIDSFPKHIVKGYASNTNIQVFHIPLWVAKTHQRKNILYGTSVNLYKGIHLKTEGKKVCQFC